MSGTWRRDLVAAAALVGLMCGPSGCGGRGPSGSGRAAASGTGAAPPAEVIATPLALIGAREGAAIARAGGRAVVAGGATAQGASADVQELRLDSGWLEPLLAALPEARVGAGAFSGPAGEVVIAGGRDAAGTARRDLVARGAAGGPFQAIGPQLERARGEVRVAVAGELIALASEGDDTVELWALRPELHRVQTLRLPGAYTDLQLVQAAPGALFVYGRGAAAGWVDLVSGELHQAPTGLPERATAVAWGGPGSEGVLLVGGLGADALPVERALLLPCPITRVGTSVGAPVGAAPGAGPVSATLLGPKLPPIERPAVAPLGGSRLLLAGGELAGAPSDRVVQVDLQAGWVREERPLAEARVGITVVADLAAERIALIGGRRPFGTSGTIDLLTVRGAGVVGPALGWTGAFEQARRERADRLAREGELAADLAATADARQRAGALQTELKGLQADLAQDQARLRQLEAELATATAELQRARAEVSALEAQLAAAEARLAQLPGQLDATAAAIARARGEREALRQQLAAARAAAATQAQATAQRQVQLSVALTSPLGTTLSASF